MIREHHMGRPRSLRRGDWLQLVDSRQLRRGRQMSRVSERMADRVELLCILERDVGRPRVVLLDQLDRDLGGILPFVDDSLSMRVSSSVFALLKSSVHSVGSGRYAVTSTGGRRRAHSRPQTSVDRLAAPSGCSDQATLGPCGRVGILLNEEPPLVRHRFRSRPASISFAAMRYMRVARKYHFALGTRRLNLRQYLPMPLHSLRRLLPGFRAACRPSSSRKYAPV